jgi:hypothetical protein
LRAQMIKSSHESMYYYLSKYYSKRHASLCLGKMILFIGLRVRLFRKKVFSLCGAI